MKKVNYLPGKRAKKVRNRITGKIAGFLVSTHALCVEFREYGNTDTTILLTQNFYNSYEIV